jgi:hypothetical protein
MGLFSFPIKSINSATQKVDKAVSTPKRLIDEAKDAIADAGVRYENYVGDVFDRIEYSIKPRIQQKANEMYESTMAYFTRQLRSIPKTDPRYNQMLKASRDFDTFAQQGKLRYAAEAQLIRESGLDNVTADFVRDNSAGIYTNQKERKQAVKNKAKQAFRALNKAQDMAYQAKKERKNFIPSGRIKYPKGNYDSRKNPTDFRARSTNASNQVNFGGIRFATPRNSNTSNNYSASFSLAGPEELSAAPAPVAPTPAPAPAPVIQKPQEIAKPKPAPAAITRPEPAPVPKPVVPSKLQEPVKPQQTSIQPVRDLKKKLKTQIEETEELAKPKVIGIKDVASKYKLPT